MLSTGDVQLCLHILTTLLVALVQKVVPHIEGALEHLCQAQTEWQLVTGSAGCFYLDLWVNLVLSSTLLNLKLLYLKGDLSAEGDLSCLFLHCCPEIPIGCGVMMPRAQRRALTEPSLGL